MYFRSKFIEISDHVSKPKLYYIENQIILQNESLPDFDPNKCSIIWPFSQNAGLKQSGRSFGPVSIQALLGRCELLRIFLVFQGIYTVRSSDYRMLESLTWFYEQLVREFLFSYPSILVATMMEEPDFDGSFGDATHFSPLLSIKITLNGFIYQTFEN